jgi:hypothetical protein
MVNNSININKRKNHLKQLNTKKTTTYGVEILGHGLIQAQKYGGVKSINGILNIEYTSSRARIEHTHIVTINKLTLNYNTTTDTTVL